MKTIFLDRDGVINKYPGDKKYVEKLSQFRFLPRVKKALAKLHRAKFRIFVISNQAGVGKGIFSQASLDQITRHMCHQVQKAKGKISAVYYCLHPPAANCSCRKPKSGLIDKARKRNQVNLKKVFFIGDTIRDVNTARAAGCKSILVFSGKEKPSNKENWETQPDFVFPNLYEAAEFVLKQK